MKAALFLFLLTWGTNTVSAQILSTPKDNAGPKEYAEYMADLYTSFLGLNAAQKEQTYITILEKRKTLDSLRSTNVHVGADKLWAINTSLDRKYKEILSAKQYYNYLDMQNVFVMTGIKDTLSAH